MVTTCSVCGTTEDGREIFSNNWWHQGDIPERFLKLIDKSHFAKWLGNHV